MKHLCAHIDISIQEICEANLYDVDDINFVLNFVLLRMSHSLKVEYMSCISYQVPNLVCFLGEVGGAYVKRALITILSLRRGAYLKLGANSSMYGSFLPFLCIKS